MLDANHHSEDIGPFQDLHTRSHKSIDRTTLSGPFRQLFSLLFFLDLADLYAWLVVFILPVNSAINPFLYTFTTPAFRATVRDLFRRTIDYASVTVQSQVPSRSVARESSVRHNDYQLPLPLTDHSRSSGKSLVKFK